MILRRAISALTWLPVAAVVSQTLVTIHPVRNSLMAPSLPADSYTLVSRSTQPHNLTRGEVVLVSDPCANGSHARRLVALPGDYVTHGPAASEKVAIVPNGFVWLEPDRREDGVEAQVDSWTYGAYPVALITGRVTRLLPSGRLVERRPSDCVIGSKQAY